MSAPLLNGRLNPRNTSFVNDVIPSRQTVGRCDNKNLLPGLDFRATIQKLVNRDSNLPGHRGLKTRAHSIIFRLI